VNTLAEYPPLQLPGEPDILAEVRLRSELRILRTLATMHGRTMRMREAYLKRWPGVYEAMEIVEPPPRFLEQEMALAPRIKGRLLEVERYFVEKSWHLPKWTRPGWLLE